jgi:hypothetical protein
MYCENMYLTLQNMELIEMWWSIIIKDLYSLPFQ